jgi:hypothetical protein
MPPAQSYLSRSKGAIFLTALPSALTRFIAPSRDACQRLNGKVLHGKCLRVELSSTSTSQKPPRGKVERNPSPPPRRRDTRQPPNSTSSSSHAGRSSSGSGSSKSSNNKAAAVRKPPAPPVAIVVSDSGPRVYNGKPACTLNLSLLLLQRCLLALMCSEYSVVAAIAEMFDSIDWLSVIDC